MAQRKTSGKRQRPSDTDQLAALCARQTLQSTRAGRSLHDHAGPLLSAAGIHLQLLKMDLPQARARIVEITAILEEAMENVRAVSQELAGSSVHRGGLKAALARLVEAMAEAAPVEIHLDYHAARTPPMDAALPLYEAVSAAVTAAVRHGRATEVEIQVRDTPDLTVRITDNGRRNSRARLLSVSRLLARQAGLGFQVTTGKSTIVLVRAHALRRAAGR